MKGCGNRALSARRWIGLFFAGLAISAILTAAALGIALAAISDAVAVVLFLLI